MAFGNNASIFPFIPNSGGKVLLELGFGYFMAKATRGSHSILKG